MKYKYKIQSRESGASIELFSTLKKAQEKLMRFELEDKTEGVFEKNFYEIKKLD